MFLLLTLICLVILSVPAAQAGWVVAAHADGQAPLSQSEIIQVFSLRSRVNSAGHPVQVISFPPDAPQFHQFVTQCLHMSPRVIERIWRRNRFTGAGWVPVYVDSFEQMVDLLRRHPGTIGYLPEEPGKENGVEIKFRCE